MRRPDIEPLDLAGVGIEAPQRDAGRRQPAVPRQKEPPVGTRVFAGQRRQLRLETLEAEVDL